MPTILIMCCHLKTWGSLLGMVWKRTKDTSDGFIPSHIHTSFFWIPRPPKQEALDEIDVEQDGEKGYLDLAGRLGRIRDCVYVVMVSVVVEQGFEECRHLEAILGEVHGGRVYRHRRVVGVAGVTMVDFMLWCCNRWIIVILILMLSLN